MALKRSIREAETVTELPEYLFKTTPYRHQELCLERSRRLDAFALLMEPGTGKTKLDIDDTCDLYDRGEIDMHLIFAPNGVHRQWLEEEYPKHAPIAYHGAFWRSGTSNKDVAAVLADPRPRLKVVAVNIEAMSHKSIVKQVFEMVKGRKVKISVDESQTIKTPGASRTKSMLKLRDMSLYRRLLTGTEISTGYENLYSQFAFLDPGIIGCHTYTEFKHEYCITRIMGDYPVIVGYRNIERLRERMAPYVFMAEKLDCLDLPPFSDVLHYVDMTPAQSRVYIDLRDEYLAELESGQIVEASITMVRAQTLSQITGGHAQYGKGRWEPIDATPRFDLTRELIEEARGKVIVWAEWQPDIIQLSATMEKAGIKHVTYFGGNSNDQNSANLHKFRNDPEMKVWIATPASGGTGLTINEADTVVFFNLGTFAINKQARARNHRPGQTKPVTYHTIMARNTVDIKRKKAIDAGRDLAADFRDPEVFKRWLLAPDTEEL